MFVQTFSGFPKKSTEDPATKQSADSSNKSCDSGKNSHGDSLETNISIGPQFPPSLKNKNEDSGPTSSQSPKDYNCPALPPGFGKSTTAKSEESETRANQVIGPVLPPHLKSSSGSSQRSRSGVIGPALPPGFSAASRGEDFSDSSADEETIGPLPSEMNKDESTRYTAYQFEERSRKMKDRLEGKVRFKTLITHNNLTMYYQVCRPANL